MSRFSSSISPDPSLIRYDLLLVALGKHLHPDPLNRPDFDCVIGKRQYCGKSNLYSVCQPMSKSERALLQRFLAKHSCGLPKLHARMSESELENFYDIYRKIPDRPEWEPQIYSLDEQIALREARLKARSGHDAQMKEAIALGHVRIFDSNRVRQSALQFAIHSFVPREDAETYMKERLLSLDQVIGGAEKKESSKVPREEWTPEFSREAALLVKLHKVKGAAEKLGMSTTKLAKGVQRWNKKLRAGQPARPPSQPTSGAAPKSPWTNGLGARESD